MDYLYSIIFGAVQGITEFLPISSSGHLVLLHYIFNFETANELSFDVALHAGSLIALVAYFWKDIVSYIIAFFSSLKKWNYATDENQRIVWLIIIATIPAGLIGYFFENLIEEKLRGVLIVAIMLILVGILFFIFEKFSRQNQALNQATAGKALIIGFSQALALIPGVSRSGISILAGMGTGLKRVDSARFAFLMSIPIFLGAVLKKALDLPGLNLGGHDAFILLLGLFSSLIVSFLAIKFLIGFLEKHSLNGFGVYRIVVGIVVLALLFI